MNWIPKCEMWDRAQNSSKRGRLGEGSPDALIGSLLWGVDASSAIFDIHKSQLSAYDLGNFLRSQGQNTGLLEKNFAGASTDFIWWFCIKNLANRWFLVWLQSIDKFAVLIRFTVSGWWRRGARFRNFIFISVSMHLYNLFDNNNNIVFIKFIYDYYTILELHIIFYS